MYSRFDNHSIHSEQSRVVRCRDRTYAQFSRNLGEFMRSWYKKMNKKLSVAETARRFVSLNILLSHSRSFEMTLLSRACVSPYLYLIETMSVCRTVYEIFSVKEWRDLETGGRGRSRSLKMVPFDRSYATFYWSAIVSVAVCCTIFKLFDVQ